MEYFNDQFYNFLETCSIHGFKKTFDKCCKIYRNVLWGFALLIMIAFSILLIHDVIIVYLKHEYITSISVQSESTEIYPSLAFCSLSQFNYTAVDNTYPLFLEFTNKHIEREYTSYYDNESFHHELDMELQVLQENILSEYGNVTFDDFWSDISFDPEAIFISCQKSQLPFSCSNYVTAMFIEKEYCFKFNSYDVMQSEQLLETQEPGTSEELSITLDVGISDYYPNEYHSYGYFVSINYPGTYPWVKRDSVLIDVGKDHMLSFSTTKTTRLGKPYSKDDCVDTSDSKHKHYTKSLCYSECLQKLSIQNCNCYLIEGHLNACRLQEYLECCLPFNSNTFIWANIIENCNCKPPCKEINFKTILTSSDYPNYKVVELARVENWPYQSYEDIKNNYLHVHIYFNTFDEKIIKETKAMTVEDVFSNIGGALGLCVGASLITWIEFMDLFVIVLWNFCRKKWERMTKREDKSNKHKK